MSMQPGNAARRRPGVSVPNGREADPGAVLRTRLSVPQPRPPFVPRRRLLDSLSHGVR
jgi:hypothetical protein